jgi:hypothetical protein
MTEAEGRERETITAQALLGRAYHRIIAGDYGAWKFSSACGRVITEESILDDTTRVAGSIEQVTCVACLGWGP